MHQNNSNNICLLISLVKHNLVQFYSIRVYKVGRSDNVIQDEKVEYCSSVFTHPHTHTQTHTPHGDDEFTVFQFKIL